MENMTKEQTAFDYSGWSRDALIYHIITLENKLASGSVAAPKERSQHEDELQSEWERGYKIAKGEDLPMIEKAFLAGRSKTSWEQFKMDNEL